MAEIAPVQRVAKDAIRLERLLDAPIEAVWRYLTQADLREQWFMGGTDASDGGEFELVVDHDKLSSEAVPYPHSYECFKGKVFREKVIRFEPPHLLETTFQSGSNGIVTYELIQEGAKTRLILTHSKIVSAVGAQDFGSGWNSHLEVLQEKLAGRSVKDFWALHSRSRDEVARALA
jgi:uncharacterized protein YndB with AHSA1/START domain